VLNAAHAMTVLHLCKGCMCMCVAANAGVLRGALCVLPGSRRVWGGGGRGGCIASLQFLGGPGCFKASIHYQAILGHSWAVTTTVNAGTRPSLRYSTRELLLLL